MLLGLYYEGYSYVGYRLHDSVGIHGLGIMRNIICIIIVVGDIKRLRLAIILGWIM